MALLSVESSGFYIDSENLFLVKDSYGVNERMLYFPKGVTFLHSAFNT